MIIFQPQNLEISLENVILAFVIRLMNLMKFLNFLVFNYLKNIYNYNSPLLKSGLLLKLLVLII